MYGWRSWSPKLFAGQHIVHMGKEVHGSPTDATSNMRVAFESFEGACCVDHNIQTALKTSSKSTFIEKLERACRGIVNHSRRSHKVCIFTGLGQYLLICTCSYLSCVLCFTLVGFRSSLYIMKNLYKMKIRLLQFPWWLTPKRWNCSYQCRKWTSIPLEMMKFLIGRRFTSKCSQTLEKLQDNSLPCQHHQPGLSVYLVEAERHMATSARV